MGIGIMRGSKCSATSSCGILKKTSACGAPTVSRFGNPDPRRFEIIRSAEFGSYTVVEVVYPDAKNYEGRKVMVYACALDKIRMQSELDPHFCDDGSHLAPFARFEPTEAGWHAACDFATYR